MTCRITIHFAAVLVLILSSSVLAQQDGPRLPESPAIGLPPAPEEIKLPPAPEAVNLPPEPEGMLEEDLKRQTDSKFIGLPPPPKLTDKYPGNQVIVIGENDPRVAVDQSEMPWRAIGRLQAGRGSCTAALIGPSLLLTAAHCVYDAGARQYHQAKNLHFKLGYAQGAFTADARGVRLIVDEAYDPVLNIGTMSKDWAVIELDEAIGTPENTLTMLDKTPTAGDIAALGGYANDMIETLMADPNCNVLGLMTDAGGAPLIRHNCAATQGVSGAPLLIRNGQAWGVGGILVVGTAQGIGGAAVLYDVLEAVDRLRAKPERN